MHKFILPQLPPIFKQFGICAIFEDAQDELFEWVKKNETDLRCSLEQGGEKFWIKVDVDSWKDGTVHFHVELCRLDDDNDDDEFEDFSKAAAVIDDFIARAEGIEAVVQSRGRLTFPRSELPQHGVISSLLDFRRKSCGAALSVDGAKLKVEDDFFTRIDFHWNEEESKVYAQLWLEAISEIEDEFMPEFAELMSTGVDCFVFERVTREQLDASRKT